jgi:hypothetical protein
LDLRITDVDPGDVSLVVRERELGHLPVDEGAKEQQEQNGHQVKIAFTDDLLLEHMVDGVKRVCRIAERLVDGEGLKFSLFGHCDAVDVVDNLKGRCSRK